MAATGQQAAGQAGEGQAQGQQQADGGQQQGGDLAALAGHLEQLSQGQQEMREWLQGQQQQGQQQGEQQQEQAPIDLSFIDTGDPAYDRQLAQQMAETFERTMQQREQALSERFEQRFGAFDERITEREREEQARDLVSEFPEMGQQETANQVVTYAQQLAQANGHPELAAEPWFWRLTYMAGRAADAAQAEGQGSGDPGAAHLEGGGGANPGAGGQVDPGDAWIKNALSDGQGHRALPFH